MAEERKVEMMSRSGAHLLLEAERMDDVAW